MLLDYLEELKAKRKVKQPGRTDSLAVVRGKKLLRVKPNSLSIVDGVLIDRLRNYAWFIDKDGYVRTNIVACRKTYNIFLHQVVLGKKKGFVTDHINSNKLDNRLSNLRFADKYLSAINRSKSMFRNGIKKTSGFKGVFYREHKYRKKKWASSICYKGKNTFLGYFYKEKEASNAYNKFYKNLIKNHLKTHEQPLEEEKINLGLSRRKEII